MAGAVGDRDGWMRGLVFAALALIAGGYLAYGNPDVTVRSSDGRWADSEDQFNGRRFEHLVWNFEGYKLKCDARNAVLLRATPKIWFNIFAWPSYRSNPKWRVPYSSAHPELGDYYPPANDNANCDNVGWSPEFIKGADVNSARYLGELKRARNSEEN